ncbi:RNA-directed DNA polymerase, eukaryota, reverse transcriptase zinc-binding domain protein [Tanacetum coccineum]
MVVGDHGKGTPPNATYEENVGQCSTPISPTDAPNKELIKRLFFFQFSSKDGLNAMLENGPWFIRNNLLILKKWNPDVNLQKEDVHSVPVWVKFHGVPITVFSEDGLSIIATKLVSPNIVERVSGFLTFTELYGVLLIRREDERFECSTQ